MKKIAILIVLWCFSNVSLACSQLTIVDGKLQNLGDSNSMWQSNRADDICTLNNPQHAQINWVIKVYPYNPYDPKKSPANPINVTCNGILHIVKGGDAIVCPTNNSVTWSNINNTAMAVGDAGL